MKSLARWGVVMFTGVLVATTAHASGLRLNPEHPAAGQPFTIDVDYTSTHCAGPLNPVSARLEPPNPAYDFVSVTIAASLQCTADVTGPSVFHMSATMAGLPEGTYPVYSSVGILDGFDPPFIDFIPQGTVVVGGGGGGGAVNSVPAVSAWGAVLLVLAIGLCARGRTGRETRKVES